MWLTNILNKKQEIEQKDLFVLAHHDYKKGLNAHAFLKMHNNNTCEDLVQNTFMKTWVYMKSGKKIEKMKSFLHHILNNLIVDEYRKHKDLSLDALIEKGFTVSSESSKKLFNIIDGKKAFSLVEKLPEKYKEIIKMYYQQDLTIKEMSFIKKISNNAVTVQIHRGIKKLKLLFL